MIDHISTYSLDYLKTRDFYKKIFLPLEFRLVTEIVTHWDIEFPTRRCGAFGSGEKCSFWIIESKDEFTPRHVAFGAQNRDAVDSFFQSALDAGASSNGEPGYRPEYHDSYYAAFVFDPDGNDIEAVCHLPQ